MEIISGTTPTLIFTFKEIEPNRISACYMLIKQRGQIIVQKTLRDGVISNGGLGFTLTQSDTLSLTTSSPAQVMLDWKTIDGVRGRSNIYECGVKVAGIDNEY